MQAASPTNVTATSFLYDVVAIAIQLHLLDIEFDNYKQILKHNAAVIFNAIRCVRKQEDEVHITRVFMPWYRQVYQSFIRSIPEDRINDIPEISSTIIQNRLGKQLQPFASFASTGSLHYWQYTSGTISRKSLEDIILDPEVIIQIEQDLHLPQSRNFIIRQQEQKRQNMQLVRSSLKCAQGLRPFSSPPVVSSTICCPDLCNEAHLLRVGVSLTAEKCCLEYHKDPDALLKGPLRLIATVHVDAYGSSPTGATTLDI